MHYCSSFTNPSIVRFGASIHLVFLTTLSRSKTTRSAESESLVPFVRHPPMLSSVCKSRILASHFGSGLAPTTAANVNLQHVVFLAASSPVAVPLRSSCNILHWPGVSAQLSRLYTIFRGVQRVALRGADRCGPANHILQNLVSGISEPCRAKNGSSVVGKRASGSEDLHCT